MLDERGFVRSYDGMLSCTGVHTDCKTGKGISNMLSTGNGMIAKLSCCAIRNSCNVVGSGSNGVMPGCGNGIPLVVGSLPGPAVE